MSKAVDVYLSGILNMFCFVLFFNGTAWLFGF